MAQAKSDEWERPRRELTERERRGKKELGQDCHSEIGRSFHFHLLRFSFECWAPHYLKRCAKFSAAHPSSWRGKPRWQNLSLFHQVVFIFPFSFKGHSRLIPGTEDLLYILTWTRLQMTLTLFSSFWTSCGDRLVGTKRQLSSFFVVFLYFLQRLCFKRSLSSAEHGPRGASVGNAGSRASLSLEKEKKKKNSPSLPNKCIFGTWLVRHSPKFNLSKRRRTGDKNAPQSLSFFFYFQQQVNHLVWLRLVGYSPLLIGDGAQQSRGCHQQVARLMLFALLGPRTSQY